MSTPPSLTVLLNRLLTRGKLRHMQVILQLAELGSLQRASEALGMTQSGVTQTLAYVEKLLETRLFERHSRGVRPTPTCADLLPAARQILLGATAGAEAVAARFGKGEGLVNLVGSVTAMQGLLVDVLPRFARLHPHIQVHVAEAEGEELLLAIARGQADLVACREPAVLPEGWSFLPLLQGRMAILCAADHPLARRKRPPSWRALSEHAWIALPASTITRQMFDALAAEKFPQPPVVYPVVSRAPSLLWWLLRFECTLAYLPWGYLRPLIDAGDLVEIRMEGLHALPPTGIIHRKGELPRATAVLLEFMRQRFAA